MNMPTAERRSGEAQVEDALREDPYGFAFFQAVRLLTRLHDDRSPIGEWADPSREIVRFSASTSLGFPPSEIHSLTMPAPDVGERSAQANMTVNFFGLTGPQGVMPHLYTEHAATRARAKDHAFHDFLDLFNHRAISLFYRSWEKSRFAVAHEAGREDRLFEHLLDLGGLGTSGLRNRLPVRDEVFAYYAGVLAHAARPANGLARLIGDYFEVETSVEQFVGEWRRVSSGGQATLGAEGEAGQLGFGIVGDAAWDPQARVRLRLGPLTRHQFNEFLPGGAAYETLRALVRLYTDDQVGVDAQLVLAREHVAPCVVGGVPGDTADTGPPRLGRGTWLASRPLERDPDETTLRLC